MSMTREEAIKSLQNIVEYWTYKPTEVEAAKMAIRALRPISREQVEKVWRGCDLCLDDSWNRWLTIQKRFDHTNLSYGEMALFCPGCGRPLTDEAVEMVMERLEEIKNG